MKITTLEKLPDDQETVLAWNQLALRMERPQVFFTYQWALAADRAFRESLSPLTLLAHESGQLVGVAALARRRDSQDTAFFLAASTADYCDILSEPQSRIPIVAAIMREIDRIGVKNIVLANLPVESQTRHAIKLASRSYHFYRHERSAYDCGVITLDDEEQRQSVLKSVVRKERVKRGLKRLSQLGPVGITDWNPEQMESGLPAIFRAQITRFLATGRLSPLVRADRRKFLSQLGSLLSSAGWLKVTQMEVNGQPLAWNFGFRFVDSWFWYLPTFQIEYEESSPGSCLLRLLTEEACADPSVKRLDLGLGDEPYKKRFSNGISSTLYVQLSKSISNHLLVLGRHWFAVAMGKFPTIDGRLRSGRDLLRAQRSRIREAGLAATLVRVLRLARRWVVSEDEAAFFEAPEIRERELHTGKLMPLSWKHIGSAAIDYADDEGTLRYLMRCAQRLRRGRGQGYLLEDRGTVAHFLWIEPYDGFHLSEIDTRLDVTDPAADMIFDCWTPVAQRGRGYYAAAIRLAAEQLQRQQKKVWIFSAVKNRSSIAGILKAGFGYRFSLVRRKRLWHSAVSRHLHTDLHS